MKWFVLTFFILSIPPLSGWLRSNPHRIPQIWILMGLLPFVLEPLHLFMAIISWPFWPGHVAGAEVSVIDILAIAMLISFPRTRNPKPFRVAAAAYFVAVLLSIIQADVPQPVLFYLFQLVRMYVLLVAASRACSDERVALALLQGMGIGLCFEAGTVILQRYGLGELQTGGTFPHQNGLGMVSHFVVFPFFALLLAGKRGWAPIGVPVAGIVTALMTISRATLGLGGIAYAVLFVISAMRKWTPRKGRLAFVAVLLSAALVPLALLSLQTRFAVNPLTDEYDERAAFENAAAAMLSDHPMGVGANSYIVIANTRGYNAQAGVAPTRGSSGAEVHNVYRLVAAETGYLGLISFVILLMQPMIVAFVWGWRNRNDIRGDLLLGLGVSLLVVYVHSLFEWVFITYYVQYFFAVECGLIVGLARQLGYQREKKVAA